MIIWPGYISDQFEMQRFKVSSTKANSKKDAVLQCTAQCILLSGLSPTQVPSTIHNSVFLVISYTHPRYKKSRGSNPSSYVLIWTSMTKVTEIMIGISQKIIDRLIYHSRHSLENHIFSILLVSQYREVQVGRRWYEICTFHWAWSKVLYIQDWG